MKAMIEKCKYIDWKSLLLANYKSLDIKEEEVLIIPNEHLLIEFDFNKENTYEVVINYQETPLIDLLKENALRVLLKAEEDHMKKLNIYNKLIKLTSVIEIVDFISSCEIKKEYISAILEIL